MDSWQGVRLKSMLLGIAVVIVGLCPPAHAAGPKQVAKIDMTLWSAPLNTAQGFDQASLALLQIYLTQLNTAYAATDHQIMKATGLKQINRASVKRWLTQEKQATFANINQANISQAKLTCPAATHCADKQPTLQTGLDTHEKWLQSAQQFIQAYLWEQIRLAALFPAISSEIDTFNPQEITGNQLADRQFLLSFDDGPTAVQGTTERTIAVLRQYRVNGTFFVLGDHFQTRLKQQKAAELQALYQGQCVALHGWQHDSHARMANWQQSIIQSRQLVTQTLTPHQITALFRPPYGQRRADSGAFFQAQGLTVALWNIDSQDWHASVNRTDVLNRVLALMLLKRKGIILFHDIHPKAAAALPDLFNQLGSAVNWTDCHQFGKP